ncbi:MAG: hypothetical protein V4539_09265 [Bacteroidota bacterium]
MEDKIIEKTLNRISEERIQDAQELKNVKTIQEKQQQSFKESQEKLNSVTQEIKTMKTEQQTLLQQISAPIKQLEEFGAKIDSHSELLKKPLIQKVVHEHHVPKLFYATVALFCICLCFGFGWFQTGQHLKLYRNNDTKWRKFLLGAKPIITEILQDISNEVENDPDKTREEVEKQETHNSQVWDLQQKMKADSAQMHELQPTNPSGNNSTHIHKN